MSTIEQAMGSEFDDKINSAYSKFIAIVAKLMTYKNYDNPERVVDDNLLNDREKKIIKSTWKKAASLGIANVGELLFKNIFSICPEAAGVFSFGKTKDFQKSAAFTEHGKKVVLAMDEAVKNIDDADALKLICQKLYNTHEKFNFKAEHFTIVMLALLDTFEAGLGD